MYIDDFIWLPDILEKLAVKHHVTEDELQLTRMSMHKLQLRPMLVAFCLRHWLTCGWLKDYKRQGRRKRCRELFSLPVIAELRPAEPA